MVRVNRQSSGAIPRDLLRPVRMRFYQVQRGQTLAMARGAGGSSPNDQAVAVFRQRMPHEGQFGFLGALLAVKPCIGAVVEA